MYHRVQKRSTLETRDDTAINRRPSSQSRICPSDVASDLYFFSIGFTRVVARPHSKVLF